jgi:signal transduction histidine kinase
MPFKGSTPKRGGFVVNVPPSAQHGLQNDLVLFRENWTAALSGLLAQSRNEEVGRMTELTYVDRIGGISTILAGTSDRIQRAVGDAAAAADRLKALSAELSGATAARLREGVEKVESELVTAKSIISTFERVSAMQLRDQNVDIDLVQFVRGCVELLPHTDGFDINVTSASSQMMWMGYPGALSQVVRKLVHGAVRHAYEEEGAGKIDVRILDRPGGYCIEVEDYGRGFPLELLERLEHPVDMAVPTTVGMKLAVARTLTTERLRGRLLCTSEPERGTKFMVHLPREVAADPAIRR